MGFCAYSLEVDWAIEPGQVGAASAAVNKEFGEQFDGGLTSPNDAVEELTSFEQCVIDAAGVLQLGHHGDGYLIGTDELLTVLGDFAVEKSCASFAGEDGSLFGFRVVSGKTCTEWGDYLWRLDSELPPQPDGEQSAEPTGELPPDAGAEVAA
ncbi:MULTISPECIES: hypothetical protein [Mycobacterium avium complex (MAC)]|uniref:Uncharacterized protein n=1 Tax=Mycobacterium intracellulare subsp. chimaera TaxID=222805 RepID=A0ABT7PAN5_MYCIT|nr:MULTISPECIES: hypothetical protein [Mycobacterium avium complex (MAC)]AOS94713.1 hypothetical protein AN480_26810 [Mycobacterium intracellulare subsp. chimaera]MDM3930210.1 hypothetical protein [Mycobacterium intracellulare subsp. chimaera]PBA69186.1 hypothetical protein CKJ76_24500 [Mycobacterium avium]